MLGVVIPGGGEDGNDGNSGDGDAGDAGAIPGGGEDTGSGHSHNDYIIHNCIITMSPKPDILTVKTGSIRKTRKCTQSQRNRKITKFQSKKGSSRPPAITGLYQWERQAPEQRAVCPRSHAC